MLRPPRKVRAKKWLGFSEVAQASAREAQRDARVHLPEEGSYLRLIDACITQPKAQGPSRYLRLCVRLIDSCITQRKAQGL